MRIRIDSVSSRGKFYGYNYVTYPLVVSSKAQSLIFVIRCFICKYEIHKKNFSFSHVDSKSISASTRLPLPQ